MVCKKQKVFIVASFYYNKPINIEVISMVSHGGGHPASNTARIRRNFFEKEIVVLLEDLKKREGKLAADAATLEKLLEQLDRLTFDLNRGQAKQVCKALEGFLKRLRKDLNEIKTEERTIESWTRKLEVDIRKFSWWKD